MPSFIPDAHVIIASIHGRRSGSSADQPREGAFGFEEQNISRLLAATMTDPGKGRKRSVYLHVPIIWLLWMVIFHYYGGWKISKIVKMATELNMSHLFSKSSTRCCNQTYAGYQEGIILKLIQMLHVWNIY